jgi:single-strand DNA-binding protein
MLKRLAERRLAVPQRSGGVDAVFRLRESSGSDASDRRIGGRERNQAMPDLNKVFLMGRLTFDPELRRTPSGTAVTELRMASSRSWSGRDGERREETLFIDVTVWDRQAETCCQYLRKGSSIHVEGYLRVDTWDDKTTGEKRSKIRVQADRVQFLDSRRNEGGGDTGGVGDDELGGPASAVREPASRHAPSAGPGESRGPSNGSGPGRAPYPSTTNPRNRPVTEPEERDEEDIPF